MEKVLETPPRNPTEFIEKTPPQTLNIDKSSTPNPLKVPKSFKYPERYMSPTDLMMSPVSKGLLARSKKPGSCYRRLSIHQRFWNHASRMRVSLKPEYRCRYVEQGVLILYINWEKQLGCRAKNLSSFGC